MLRDVARRPLAAPSPRKRRQSLAAAAEAGNLAAAADRDAWLRPSQAEGLMAEAAGAEDLAAAAQQWAAAA